MSNEEENEKSIYNYNMIFNRINNYDDDTKINTDLINDIDLQNFDPKRYEYYTNLLYIYNKDPKTLYDLLNKYYNVKSMHQKEKGIIKYIYDYARKLKELENDDKGGEGDEGDEGGGATGGGSRKRRNRQAGGVNTWQDKFIDVLKRKMPKVVKKPEPSNQKEPEDNADTEDDEEYPNEKSKYDELVKRIDELTQKITTLDERKNKTTNSISGNSHDAASVLQQAPSSSGSSGSSGAAAVAPSSSGTSSGTTPSPNGTTKTEEIPLGNVIDELVNIVSVLTAQVVAPSGAAASSGAVAESSLEVLNTLTNLADTLQEKIKNSPSEQTRITEKQEADLASTISSLQYLTTALISGSMNGGAGNSDEQLKMKYLDNNKYKEINTWKKIKELKGNSKSQSDNVDENNKIGQLSKDIDAYNYSDKDENDTKYIIQQLNNFENDPKNPLDELAITFDDRIVFIIATFFIRYITIIIVQWCIDINIIKTFYEGFIYYAIIYIIIFWFIVLFINIDNSYDVKYMNFNGIINSIRTLFYYFYMGTNGISRLLVHTSLIIILIIIPIILNIKRKADYVDDEQTETEKILNNDERKQLSKSLSLFTMFIWLFTSIIATKF